jgi:dipeptide/tripeptide permease
MRLSGNKQMSAGVRFALAWAVCSLSNLIVQAAIQGDEQKAQARIQRQVEIFFFLYYSLFSNQSSRD